MREIISDRTKIEVFVRAFRSKKLPKSKWSHEAHFVAALWHILNFDFEESVDRMRIGIKSFNESVGGKNTDTEGYHETITLFYMDALDDFVVRNADADHMELYSRLLDDEVIEPDYLLQFYSKETLFSKEARKKWVAPDLKTPAFLLR